MNVWFFAKNTTKVDNFDDTSQYNLTTNRAISGDETVNFVSDSEHMGLNFKFLNIFMEVYSII